MRETIVVGGGVAGVAVAWQLASRGHPVTLIEADDEVGRAASFANGGLLTRAMSDPWNGPGVSWNLLRSLFQQRAGLKLQPRALPSLRRWGPAFLRNSTAARFENAYRASFRLADYSLAHLAAVRVATGINFCAARRGAMKILRDGESARSAMALAEMRASDGLRFERLDADAAIALEPQLGAIRDKLFGAIYFPDDECGDARAFCAELTARFVAAGGSLRTGTRVIRLVVDSRAVTGVDTSNEFLAASRVVVAAGTSSVPLLETCGVHLRIHPVKGYSMTFELANAASLPRIPVADRSVHGAVIPLGARLRVVGYAEFAGQGLEVSARTVANLRALLASIYPQLAAELRQSVPVSWAGLRPMAADGLPFIGATVVDGLFVSTGHGHLGWTQAMGSAALLLDLMTGRRPEIDAMPYSPLREL